MDKKEEKILIERIKIGEHNLYAQLVDHYSDIIFNLIYKVVGVRADAEELAQDVFVKAFFSLDKFRGESSFSTWLYRIAYNLAISKSRLKKRFFLSLDNLSFNKTEELDDADHLLREENFVLLEEALESLDIQERFLVVSFYKDDKSLKELSEITGITVSNLKIKLFRTRKKLNDYICSRREVIYGKWNKIG